MSQRGTCVACAEPIVWAMVRKLDGSYSRMPIDVDPAPDGNLAIYRDHLGAIKARTLKKGEEPDQYERRGKTHFATCKHRDRFRKRADGLPQNVIPFRRRKRDAS
jgi:hypothetical protein